MKNLLAILLAICMMITLCACGSGTDSSTPAPAATTAPSGDAGEDTEPAGDSDLMAVVQTCLGNAISFDDYELSYADEETMTLFYLNSENIELDYTIQLDDGTTIQLPMVYGELLDAGWTSSTQWTETVKGNSMGSATHTNSQGNTIYISIINPTDQFMDLTDTWVNNVTVGGERTAPFDTHGIHEGSSVADAIAVWGNPESISFYSGDTYQELDLTYVAEDGTLALRIDTQTGLISSVTYYFSTNYIPES